MGRDGIASQPSRPQGSKGGQRQQGRKRDQGKGTLMVCVCGLTWFMACVLCC